MIIENRIIVFDIKYLLLRYHLIYLIISKDIKRGMSMKKLIETILIKLHERKEARLYNAWAREQENERHARMISEAEQLASRPAYRPTAVNEAVLELKKAA